MTFFDIVGIAASTGGIKAIIEVVSGLPPNFPVPVLVVLHLSPDFESHLAYILSKYTFLKVKEAEDGEKIVPGTIYTPKPNMHIIVNPDGTVSLASLEKVHFVRPAADILFVSMAITHREKAIGVILSGAGMDGATGSFAVKKAGGKVIVQEDPEVPNMPEAAIKIDEVDHILPLAKIAPTLVELVTRGKSELDRHENKDETASSHSPKT